MSSRDVLDKPNDIARARRVAVWDDSLPPFKIAAFPDEDHGILLSSM